MSGRPVDILRAAREMVAVPERWTRGANAQSSSGCCVDAFSDEASCWCSWGAMLASRGGSSLSAFDTAEDALCRAACRLFPERVLNPFQAEINVNDHSDTVHADVLAVFDAAIAEQEASA